MGWLSESRNNRRIRDLDGKLISSEIPQTVCGKSERSFRETEGTVNRRTPLHFGSGVHGCGGGFEPPTFGLCDLTHLSMRVGLYLDPRGMLAIQSLRLPPKSGGLGRYSPIARAT